MALGALPGSSARQISAWKWSIAAWLALARLPDGKLHIYFLDVGQGDAIFIRAPDGRQMLVDGEQTPVLPDGVAVGHAAM